MAAVRLFKRMACFALSGFMWHSTATWCALWVAANLQDSGSRARGCVWMEEYLVSVLHARRNLGGLDKCTVTILYTSKLSEDDFYDIFSWISFYYLCRVVRSHFWGLLMLAVVFILVFIKPPPHTLFLPCLEKNKEKKHHKHMFIPPPFHSQCVCLLCWWFPGQTHPYYHSRVASFMALINFFVNIKK